MAAAAAVAVPAATETAAHRCPTCGQGGPQRRKKTRPQGLTPTQQAQVDAFQRDGLAGYSKTKQYYVRWKLRRLGLIEPKQYSQTAAAVRDRQYRERLRAKEAAFLEEMAALTGQNTESLAAKLHGVSGVGAGADG